MKAAAKPAVPPKAGPAGEGHPKLHTVEERQSPVRSVKLRKAAALAHTHSLGGLIGENGGPRRNGKPEVRWDSGLPLEMRWSRTKRAAEVAIIVSRSDGSGGAGDEEQRLPVSENSRRQPLGYVQGTSGAWRSMS